MKATTNSIIFHIPYTLLAAASFVLSEPQDEPAEQDWAMGGGQPCDIIHTPSRLVSVKVWSGEAINSIQFIYKDNNGNLHEFKWGGPGPEHPSVVLETSEYVKEMSGTFGDEVVKSLKFVTNKGKVYEFGQAGSGGSFDVQEGQIVAFYGRAGEFIDAIGVYVLP